MTTLIRVYKRKQFVVVETPTVEDTRLSWAARGILIYLLAKPDDWKVIVSNLVNSGDLKRDGILKRINELMKFGYIQRNKLRDKKGRILGTEYIVYERPHPDNPDTDFPVTALPATANSSLPNKQNTHEQKIELNMSFEWTMNSVRTRADTSMTLLTNSPETTTLHGPALCIEGWAKIFT